MFIESIDIQNYRGIERLHMDFKEGVNLLIGNNGAGKTSLLTALSVMLSEPLLWLAGQLRPGDREKIENDAFQTTSIIGDTVVQTVAHYPVRIEGKINFMGREYVCCQEKKSESNSVESKSSEFQNLFINAIGDQKVQMPLLSFLRAGRGKALKPKAKTVTLNTGEVERVQGYHGALTGELNMQDIQNWCVQMDFTAYQKKQEVREYKAFQNVVSRFASLIDEKSKDPKVYYSSAAGSIVYFDGTTEQPIHQLSAGYQAVLCMVIELAYRAVLLNPILDDVAAGTEGVVLIDEIEMHLHPAWQWKILDALRETFPKVQFIIATHSPIILSSAKDAALYFMKSPSEVFQLNNVYGYSINDVLAIPQGSDYQPKRIAKYYDEAERILDRGDTNQLNELLRKAENEFINEPRVLEEFRSFVEVNRWVEEA